MKRREAVGLNLLKTIAIISVVIYHIDKGLLPGGFVGVDLFFVISGYLLAHSMSKSHDISLKQIIIKRFRQLWPGLIFMIFLVMIFITIFNKTVLEHSNVDAITGLTFTNNWGLIFRNIGYFDNFVVNPFKHLWYIAVLLQSFLIINILFRGFGRLNIFNKYNAFLSLMIIMAIGSFLLQNFLFDEHNASRVYYGTDTRIYTIIIGVLGYYFRPIDFLKSRANTTKFLLINLGGILSLGAFIFFVLNASEFYNWVYRYGFLLFALNSLILIYTVGSDSNIITKIFSKFQLLLLAGKYSYGIFLWHYPVIILSQTIGERASPNIYLTLIRLVFVIIIAGFSYRYIEKPINKYGFMQTIDRSGWTIIFKSIVFYPFLVLFILGLTGISVPVVSTAFINTNRDVELDDQLIASGNLGKNKEPESNRPNTETTKEKQDNLIEKETQKETQKEENKKETVDKYNQLILIGDSLGVNIGEKLLKEYPNTIVDAKISRQLYKSFDIAEKYKNHDSKNTAVIFSLGTNGMFNKTHLDKIISYFPESKKIFFTIKAPVAWERKANELLKSYAKDKPDVEVIDWYSIANENPEYLAQDRTHLVSDGVDVIIKEIQKVLNQN